MRENPKLAKCTSVRFGITLYGILNAQGEFWTPVPFQSDGLARQYIRDFWGRQTDMAARCLNDFRIVRVRVNLTELPS